MALIDRTQLRAHPARVDVTDDEADVIIRVVGGWLLDATGLDTLPTPAADPEPDFLWSAAMELCVLAASNPEVLASKTVGPTSRAWPVAQQRDAVLDRVRARYRPGGAGNPAGEFGAFPNAWSIPDPPFGVAP